MKEKKHLKIFIHALTLASFLFNLSLLAQEQTFFSSNFSQPKFEHLTIADGLPENSVWSIFQDHLGFLWFGTQNGLVKYDGYSIVVYQPKPDDTLSISSRWIRAIFEDHRNSLWIGTADGLNRFDRATETFTLYKYNPEDTTSLNSNFVRSIYEDSAGRLWIGTHYGLNLYDREKNIFERYSFTDTIYHTEVFNHLSDLRQNENTIVSILNVGNDADITKSFVLKKTTPVLIVMTGEFDDYGWLERENGKIIFGNNLLQNVYAGGRSDNRIQIVLDTLQAGNYRLRYVSNSYHSYNNWFGAPPTYPGLWGIQVLSIDEDIEKLKQLLDYKQVITNPMPIYDIIENPQTGNLYVGTERVGLWEFDTEQKLLTRTDVLIEVMPAYITSYILSFHRAKDGTLWMATTHGLSRLDSQKEKLKTYQIIQSQGYNLLNQFNSVFEDQNGIIWVGSGYSGLLRFHPKTEKFYVNKPDQNNHYSLNNNRVWSIYEDHSGNVWAGTWGGGLNKWDRKKWKFNSLKHEAGNTNSLSHNVVNSICEDHAGKIWIGTDGGLDHFDRNKNSFTHYLYNPKNINSLSSNLISCIVEDRIEPGILWIGTKDAGLNKFDTDKGILLRYQNKPGNKYSLHDNSILTLISDHLGIIWIGTPSGFVKFDQKTGIFTRFKHDPNDPESLSENAVRALYEDPSGNIWVGTNKGGLNKFDRKTGKFIRYVSLTTDRDFSSIITIEEGDDDNLWVGTNLSGLHLFNPDAGTIIKSLTPANGLSTNGVRGILKDESENVWISTLNGIFKFNSRTNSLRGYGIGDGLSGHDFSSRCALTSKNGEMFFGGRNGITVFHPNSIHDDPVSPKVVLSNISLFNRPDEKLTINSFISDMQQIELSYDQNDLQFGFVGLHFGEPQKNQYKYMLENFDNSWVDAGTQRKAIYTNLDAGEYIFRVKAANRDGVWNEQGTSIKIIIVPPLWATWWAYILYGLFGVSILYVIRRYELNRVQWKNQAALDKVKLNEREETDKMKSRFFANISHEFRTPLTLILGPSENIITKTSENEIKNQAGLIKKNARRLLDLINQLLDLSKLEVGKLRLETSLSNIVPFVKGITMSFESLAEKRNITLKVEPMNEDITLYFDKEMMAKILTNLLSNAFKFTPEGGKITVKVGHAEFISASSSEHKIPKQVRNDVMEDSILIKIRDTGIGISEEEIPRLFDRFYQVDSSQTKEYPGTGIGLALTKELVELHKGKININSKLGEGTEFTIELPNRSTHLKDAEITKRKKNQDNVILSEAKNRLIEERTITFEKDSSSPANNIVVPQNDSDKEEEETLILIVEDNSDVREYIKDSLGKEYRIEEAVNGEQGVKKAEKIIPDLIISDVMMPKMDGNELTRTLKNDAKTSHIPIILLTAKAEQESKIEGLGTGADAYLTKPFDTKELQVRIKNLLNIRKKLQEKYSKEILVQKADRKKLSDLDEKFMSKVMEVIENHLSEEDFSIEEFDKELGMGRVQVYRKLKALTGKSPSRYIRSIRLVNAKRMMEEKKGNISEISYSVGFGSPAYFTKCFKEEFGFPPGDLTN